MIVAVAQHGHQPDQFPVYDMGGEHDLALGVELAQRWQQKPCFVEGIGRRAGKCQAMPFFDETGVIRIAP